MVVTVAGEKKTYDEGLTIAKLIEVEKVENPDYVTVTVNDEFVEWLELKRRPTQRRAVQLLPLLVTNRFFDDPDAKLGRFAIHPVLGIIEI